MLPATLSVIFAKHSPRSGGFRRSTAILTCLDGSAGSASCDRRWVTILATNAFSHGAIGAIQYAAAIAAFLADRVRGLPCHSSAIIAGWRDPIRRLYQPRPPKLHRTEYRNLADARARTWILDQPLVVLSVGRFFSGVISASAGASV